MPGFYDMFCSDVHCLFHSDGSWEVELHFWVIDEVPEALGLVQDDPGLLQEVATY